MAEHEKKDVRVVTHDEIVRKTNERLIRSNRTCAERIEKWSQTIMRNTSEMQKITAGDFSSEDVKRSIIQQIIADTQTAKPGQTLVFDLNFPISEHMKEQLDFELHEGMCDVSLKVFNIGNKSSVTITILDNSSNNIDPYCAVRGNI